MTDRRGHDRPLHGAGDATERLDRFLADQLSLSRTQAARLVAAGGVSVAGAVARASRLLERAMKCIVDAARSTSPPRHLAARRHSAHRRLRGRAPRRHRQAGRPRGASRAGPLGRHAGECARGARHPLSERGRRAGPASCTGSTAIPRGSWSWPRPTWRTAGSAPPSRRGGCSRHYAALAWGHLDASPTVIEAPLARHPQDRKRMAVSAEGRPARTDAFVVARFGLVRAAPARAAHRPHPPDPGPPGAHRAPRRGRPGLRRRGQPADPGRPPGRLADRIERATPRQALHAAGLAFRHPATGEALEFRAEWPADLMPALIARRRLGSRCSHKRLCAIFVSTSEMADVRPLHAVVFRVGGVVCALPAGIVREILPGARLPGFRGSLRRVEGLVNVRGGLVTVVDGHVLLGQPRPADAERLGAAARPRAARWPGSRWAKCSTSSRCRARRSHPREQLPGVDPRRREGGGRVGVDDGSCCSISTRCWHRCSAADQPASLKSGSGRRWSVSHTVLVCDDAIFMRTMIADILAAAGLRGRRRGGDRARRRCRSTASSSPTSSRWTS